MGDGRKEETRERRAQPEAERYVERERRTQQEGAARKHEWQSDGTKRVRGRSWIIAYSRFAALPPLATVPVPTILTS